MSDRDTPRNDETLNLTIRIRRPLDAQVIEVCWRDPMQAQMNSCSVGRCAILRRTNHIAIFIQNQASRVPSCARRQR